MSVRNSPEARGGSSRLELKPYHRSVLIIKVLRLYENMGGGLARHKHARAKLHSACIPTA